MKNRVSEYPLVIREAHLDTLGHVNNATYLAIFEEARWEIVTSAGYGIERIRKTGHAPVILEVRVKFLKELRLRARITVKSQILSYEGKISVLRQWMEDETGTLCADADFTWALFDLKQRKIIEPTPEWLFAVGAKQADHR